MNDISYELTIWHNKGSIPIDLEEYQMFAIRQILGLQIFPVNASKNEFEIRAFTEEEVMKRLNKIGIWKDGK